MKVLELFAGTRSIRMKPTDIWTNHPDPKFRPMCHNGDPCHIAAPRGAKTGTQGLKGSKERSVIPKALCEHIVDICVADLGQIMLAKLTPGREDGNGLKKQPARWEVSHKLRNL